MRVRLHRALTGAVLGALCVLLGGLAFASTPALAEHGHAFLFSFGNFPAPEVGDGAESIAVDESTGDVYVLYTGANLQKFNANGEPVAFSALDQNFINDFGSVEVFMKSQIAVDNSAGPDKGDIYFATGNGGLRVYAPDGTLLTSFAPHGAGMAGTVCGVAVDPTGAVYLGTKSGEIGKFMPSGGVLTNADFVSAISGLPGETCQVSADSEGNVYVTHWQQGPVTKYDALQFGSLAPIGTQLFSDGVTSAIDYSDGHVYVDRTHHSGTELVEFDSAGDPIGSFGTEIIHGFSLGVAVNSSTGRVYVADDGGSDVDVFSGYDVFPDLTVEAPSDVSESGVTLNATINPLGLHTTCTIEYGTEISYGNSAPCSPEDLGSGSVAIPVTVDLTGLQAGTVYHYRYVLTNQNGAKREPDQTFVSAALPAVDSQGLGTVGTTAVTLRAQINPRNWATSYHFEYGTEASYGNSAPVPDGKLATSGSDELAVWSLSGLQPGTTYHYRVVATGVFGATYGADQTFSTFASQADVEGSCPNAQIRASQGAGLLPDCRAYELVSPAAKSGADIATDPTRERSSSDGDAMVYWSQIPFGDALGSEDPGAEYIAQRGAEGWNSVPINPPQASPTEQGSSSQYVSFSPDLTEGVFFALNPVTPGHPNVSKVANLYLRDDLLSGGAGSYQLLSDSIAALPFEPAQLEHPGVQFAGASADFSHIIFETHENLTAETSALNPGLPKLYEWIDGTIRLAGILPDSACASPPCIASESIAGSGAGGGDVSFTTRGLTFNTISSDGSRIVFSGPPLSETTNFGARTQGNLYMRIDGTRTIQLNLSERTAGPSTFAPAFFWGASADDSKVFFTSNQLLTNDAVPTGSPQEADLYMYDVNAPEGHRLTLIATAASTVAGVSEDGEYVYFLSRGGLVPGHSAILEQGSNGFLYVWHDGALRAIVEHSDLYEPFWNEEVPNFALHRTQGFRMTPDGTHVAVVSGTAGALARAGVTCSPGSCGNQILTYSYATERVVCASCGSGLLGGTAAFANYENVSLLDHNDQFLNRPISDDGRYVFFDSTGALLPQATDGRSNVYEYDSATGQLHLISPGSCDCEAHFVDASPDGRNVFFTTAEHLVRSDVDGAVDMYDARVEGGIPSQNTPVTLPCTGDACQTPAQGAPDASAPASATFSGVGNVTPAPAGAVKPAAKQKTKAKPRKQTKRKRRARSKKKPKQAKKSAKRSSHRAGR